MLCSFSNTCKALEERMFLNYKECDSKILPQEPMKPKTSLSRPPFPPPGKHKFLAFRLTGFVGMFLGGARGGFGAGGFIPPPQRMFPGPRPFLDAPLFGMPQRRGDSIFVFRVVVVCL